MNWMDDEKRPHKKPVVCIETGIEYESAADAGRKTGVISQLISEAARGKAISAGGFRWRFANEEFKQYTPKPIGRKPLKVRDLQSGTVYKDAHEAAGLVGVKPQRIRQLAGRVNPTRFEYVEVEG